MEGRDEYREEVVVGRLLLDGLLLLLLLLLLVLLAYWSMVGVTPSTTCLVVGIVEREVYSCRTPPPVRAWLGAMLSDQEEPRLAVMLFWLFFSLVVKIFRGFSPEAVVAHRDCVRR